jgi:hypothetical protein
MAAKKPLSQPWSLIAINNPRKKPNPFRMAAEKYESSPDLESGAIHIDGGPLNRENTAITLSNDQYERLFFQPSKPQRGDAAKRFGMFS